MIWKIFARLPGHRSDAKDYARECYQKNVIAIGWNMLGDVTALESKEKLREVVQGWLRGNAEHETFSVAHVVGAIWAFNHEVSVGDYVICPDKDSKRYYVGKIVGRVFYDTSTIGGRCTFANRRKVKWVRTLTHEDAEKVWPGGRFGGLQTISKVSTGEDRLIRMFKERRRVKRGRRSLPVALDMEWGKEAEARAMNWLKERGDSPVDVSRLCRGWDIECGENKFEVKGRKSIRTAIRLSQNEWAAAQRIGKQYTLLIFTASNKEALQISVPAQLPNPASTESWTTRVVYEYVLHEQSAAR
jgi:hypothetical protein